MSKTVLSLFAGVGGICLGFKQAGFDVIWANEIDKNACNTYKINHSAVSLKEGDINKIDTKNIPDVDVLTAGFPCQAFSVAGYQKGFGDERGNLFFSISRILEEKINKPRVILLENVKNLVTHDNGNTFNIIKNRLEQIGYSIHYQVLNSCEYGNVPQNRERIFIIGFLNKIDYKKFCFPEKIELTKNIRTILESEQKNKKYYYNITSQYYESLVNTVNKEDTIYQIRRIYIRENKSKLCPTLTANMGTGGHNVPIIKDYFGIRKLTPRECFNLQGFPSSFILPEISDCHLYKQAGNSVTVPVIERIAKNILYTLLHSESLQTVSSLSKSVNSTANATAIL